MYYEYVLSNNSSWPSYPNALLVDIESKLIDNICWMAMQCKALTAATRVEISVSGSGAK